MKKKKKKYLRIEIANVGSSILVALGGVLTEKVSSDTRSNSSRHCRRLSEINSIETSLAEQRTESELDF